MKPLNSFAPDPSTTLHIIGRFDDPFTGAERGLLELEKMIAGRRPVQLWSSVPPHGFYAERGVRLVQPYMQQFPKTGTLLIAGVHVTLGNWLKYARYQRVILLYNLVSHERLFSMLQVLRGLTGCEPEVEFVSRALQLSAGLPGRVVNSFIDLEPFLALTREPPGTGTFTVGRVSRDVAQKHHAQDFSLYRMLAAHGIRIRILGGTCLAAGLAGTANVELLPAGAESAADFYRSLDVFFYRTGEVAEAYGRVVIEAMACGLAVVASDTGGYAEVIRHGVSGWLVQSQEEAYDTILDLQKQPELAKQAGVAARSDATSRHGKQANEAMLQSWLLSMGAAGESGAPTDS